MPVKKSRPEEKKSKATKKIQSKTKKSTAKKTVSKRSSNTKRKSSVPKKISQKKKGISTKGKKIDKKTKADIKRTVDVLPELLLMQELPEKKYVVPVVDPLLENKKKLQTHFDWTESAKRQKILWASVIFMTCIIFVMWFFNTKIVLKKIQESKPTESLITATKQSFEASKNEVSLIEKQNEKNIGKPGSSPEEQLKDALHTFMQQIQTSTSTTTSTLTITTTTEPLTINP
ncbi:MAG: hypothetical protein COV59_04770 [Candidatus Magasanikbacteria bacterium CG11_big_fil_rev_8_21_14_0_20_39_34]|uniref:Uncharacterized protein n=1 Tax=Candidatus Magasanikbacteria bacterium CG11_big_fil_rev_8_21_14_0_20_39_34 TaxID=1974653 RepID=A0A2H0N4E2_9BACT|nr:MAG: hypothetical protein COV59_04770 [Candidatus Magasanikbacteria bacterium CG11_big_fil_rev_8_21_14_0_20_39_34]